MKRADIKPGVIYAKTGALAYGREPNQNQAVRVRFLEPLVPHIRISTYRVAKTPPGRRYKHQWVRVAEEFAPTNQVGDAAKTQFVTPSPGLAEDNPVGTVRRFYREVPNLLLAEASLDGETWAKQLVAPAEVHRTWDEWIAMQAEKRAEADARAVARIPIELDSHARQLVYWAKKKAGQELQAASPDLSYPDEQERMNLGVLRAVRDALRNAGVELDLPASRKVH